MGACRIRRLDLPALRPGRAAALEDALGLAPAAASILVRRGLGDRRPRARSWPAPSRAIRWRCRVPRDACDLVLDHVRAQLSHPRLRRLRRGRRLLHRDDGRRAARGRRGSVVAAAEPARRRLWALGGRRQEAGGSRSAAARDRGLRDHRRRGGARWRASWAWTCWSPTTTGRASAFPDCPIVHPALLDPGAGLARRQHRPLRGGCGAQALGGAAGPGRASTRAARTRTSTWRGSPRSATWCPCAGRTAASRGQGSRRSRARGRPGLRALMREAGRRARATRRGRGLLPARPPAERGGPAAARRRRARAADDR